MTDKFRILSSIRSAEIEPIKTTDALPFVSFAPKYGEAKSEWMSKIEEVAVDGWRGAEL